MDLARGSLQLVGHQGGRLWTHKMGLGAWKFTEFPRKNDDLIPRKVVFHPIEKQWDFGAQKMSDKANIKTIGHDGDHPRGKQTTVVVLLFFWTRKIQGPSPGA